MRRSREAGEIYEYCGPSGSEQEAVRDDLRDIWSFVWHHDLDDDLKSAVNYLEKESIFITSIELKETVFDVKSNY